MMCPKQVLLSQENEIKLLGLASFHLVIVQISKTNVEHTHTHKKKVSVLHCKLWECRDRGNTKQHADTWEWSEPVTKHKHKKNRSCIERRESYASWRGLITQNPTKRKNMESKKTIGRLFGRLDTWHHVHGRNRANIFFLFRVSGTETGQSETMAKCLCYWSTKADSCLFAFTRSHSGLVAKWWNQHCYKRTLL